MMEDTPAAAGDAAAPAPTTSLPETEMYAYLLVLARLVHQEKWQQVGHARNKHCLVFPCHSAHPCT